MPEWPPAEYDYAKALAAEGLRAVDRVNFKSEPQLHKNLNKAYELECYPGIFKDSEGKSYDMRPDEGKPSIQAFQKKTVEELQESLKSAYSK